MMFDDGFRFSGSRWVFTQKDSSLLLIGEDEQILQAQTNWNYYDNEVMTFHEISCPKLFCMDGLGLSQFPSLRPTGNIFFFISGYHLKENCDKLANPIFQTVIKFSSIGFSFSTSI